nr:hypothetical protein [Tanacetum cinerariifolium]
MKSLNMYNCGLGRIAGNDDDDDVIDTLGLDLRGKEGGKNSSLMIIDEEEASEDDDGVPNKPSLELRFRLCMSNMVYPKYGYDEASEDDDGLLDKPSLELRGLVGREAVLKGSRGLGCGGVGGPMGCGGFVKRVLGRGEGWADIGNVGPRCSRLVRIVKVKKVGCHMKGLDPKRWGYVSLKKKGTNDIINGAYHSFSFAILLRCFRARKMELDVVIGNEYVELVIGELATLRATWAAVGFRLAIGRAGYGMLKGMIVEKGGGGLSSTAMVADF